MNPVPFLWLAAVVGFLLLEASTFSMTSVWFAVGAAAALLTCLFTDSPFPEPCGQGSRWA